MNKGYLLSIIALFSIFSLNAQDVYWPSDVSEINTGANATYIIQSANIDDTPVIFGYLLGAFYTDDNGALQCGGFTNASSAQVQIAIMGDDTTTEDKDGFGEGETITWLAYAIYDSLTYNATVSFITIPPYGSNTYSTNGINIVASFNISSAILGCTDTTACNYNYNATDDDSSCTYAEENYNCDGTCIDTDGDTVCDIDEVEGCLDETACNYNDLATDQNDSCTSPETNLDCDGNCLNDIDNDGVCDENEILGCSDVAACNFDNSATDLDDTCIYTSGCETCENGLIVDNDEDNDGVCNADEVEGCQDELACNYMVLATDDGVACTYATGDCDSCSGETNGTGLVIDNDADDDGVCNDDEEGACVDSDACNYNSNPTFEEDNFLCIYITGNCDTCSGEQDGSGSIVDNDADNDGVCNAFEIAGCTDELACNYDATATDSDESCVYVTGCETCENGSIIANDDDMDGVCNSDEIIGCNIIEACNYNENATDINNDDCTYAAGDCDECSGETNGSGVVLTNDADNDLICDADEIEGCTDMAACNYNENATDAGVCIYVDETIDCQICSGDTDGTGTVMLNDTDLDGVCDDEEVLGCTDSLYTEYSVLATELDESCQTLVVFGCIEALAFNYNMNANTANLSCIYYVEVAFSTTGTNTTLNISVPVDGISLLLGSSQITTGDQIGGFYLVDGELYCAGFNTWTGEDFSLNLWMDDPSTIEIDGITEGQTIYWIVQQEQTMFNYLVDLTLVQVSPEFTFVSQITLNTNTIIGCMDASAYNYNSEALISDGACEEFIEGCTDGDACNYDDEANSEDGSCYFITASIDFQLGQPLTVTTDAENPSYVWFLNDVEQAETSNEFTPYIDAEYAVVVTDGTGCSIEAVYNLENIGIDENLVNQMSLFPNPASNYVEIHSTNHKIETIKLYSITGKLMQEHVVNGLQYKLNRNKLASGIYFVKTTINYQEITKKINFK